MDKKVTNAPTSEHINDFLKGLDKLCYRHNGFNAFSDFLALSALDISNAVNPNEDRQQQYQKTLGKYNGEEQNAMAEMLSALVWEMTPPKGTTPRYYDVLGDLLGNLELHDAWKAQFFTPQVVSDFCGLMTFGEKLEPEIKKRGYVKMHEPCIGGGSMVIGLVNAMFQKGYNPCKQLLVVAYDIDIRCIYMSYIQLSLMGIPVILQQRDTLTLQSHDNAYWITPAFAFDDWAGKLLFEQKVRKFKDILIEFENPVVADQNHTAKFQTPVETGQLSLF